MLKGIKTLLATMSLVVFLTPISAFASTKTQTDSDFTVKDISISEIPSDVIPMKFNSEEEAENYFNNAVEGIENTNSIIVEPEISLYDYRGHRYAEKRGWPVTIAMDVPYFAKWNSKWGNYYASAGKPSTSIAGSTIGFEWREISSATYSNIGSNPTKLTAHGEGYLDYYVIIEGGIKYYTKRISVDGSWGQP